MPYIFAYKEGSQSAKELSKATGFRRIKHERSKFRGSAEKVVINWGSTKLPNEVLKCRIVNAPEAVAQASNKLTFFQTMNEAPWLPKWTADRNVARDWMRRNGTIVVCRTVLNGHSGAGIVLANTEDELVDAPLYVEYKKKQDEYRVHVCKIPDKEPLLLKVFDIQRKARRADAENPNWQIRNHQNGFIYQRNDVECPQVVPQAAVECLDRTNLDFGAVDVIYNAANNRAYVLEINTAPGLSGTTVENYSNMLKELI